MGSNDAGAPAWLFSFVDLAFLMLIAMTQLAPDPGAEMPNLGEMIVPRIGAAASTEMGSESTLVWQLRVHPPEEEATSPYELVRVVDGVPEEAPRIVVDELRRELASLRDGHGSRAAS